MRALLVGGSGFIGPHVARAPEQHGYDVVVFHRGNTVANPPDRIKMLQGMFGWLDEEYDKISVEREILGDPEIFDYAAEDAAPRSIESAHTSR
jgi:nucleoside-diphosphate-sugar epimerase